MNYQKMIYNLNGGKMVDIFAPNNKIASNFFSQFTNQQNQYLLSNGVDFSGNEQNKQIKETLGEDFDTILQRGGKWSLVGGVSFGFWNLDHLEFFKITEFVPLYDEVTSELKLGIRFWRIDENKPLNIVLYELDGVTEYQYSSGTKKVAESWTTIKGKQAYRTTLRQDGEYVEVADEKNYPMFPIIPLYANENGDSELTGSRNTIDLYDRIFSDFGNDFDRNSLIFWILENYGGMENSDLIHFQAQLKTMAIANVNSDGESGAKATPHVIDVPYEARKVALDLLERRLYKDYGAIDISNLSSNATQDEINMKYMPLDLKVDAYEFQIIEFIQSLCSLLGFDKVMPKFKRAKMESARNKADIEEVEARTRQMLTNMLLLLLPHVDVETFLKLLVQNKIIDLKELENIDKKDISAIVAIIKAKELEAQNLFNNQPELDEIIEEEVVVEEGE